MKRIALLIALALLLPGCATIISGTSRPIQFDSTPPGANVSFQGKQCKTPCEIIGKLDAAKTPTMLKVELTGREPYWSELTQSDTTDAKTQTLAVIGALLIVPGFIDLGTGALADWPKKVNVVLPEKGKGSAIAEIIR